MTAPLAPAGIGGGAPESEQVEAARAEVRARHAARQDQTAARQAARDEERKLRLARHAAKTEARRLARQDRADDIAGGAGSWVRRAAPVVFAAVPVVMVNATAFIGQFAYIRDHVPWVLPGQVLAAATFESVAVYIAWHAHLAKMKNDSATRLVIGAQLFALVMGLMNYSHYSVRWHPTVMAVGLGLMSLLSPLLWGIYSKRASRDKLMAEGLIEPHAVRLGANRWTWHPVRSVEVMWRATWLGEIDPKRAIALYEAAETARRAVRLARRKARQPARGAEKSAPAVARQGAPEVTAPVAREAMPAGGAPALPAAPADQDGRAALLRMGYSETQIDAMPIVGEPGSAAYWLPSGGPQDVIPGTRLNGHPVRAIATLSAKPTMKSSHEINPQRITEAELYLSSLPLSELPSERAVAKMLCEQQHDHRRQAKPLLDARRAAGHDPAPVLAQRHRPSGAPVSIAAPVSTLPGGKQANG